MPSEQKYLVILLGPTGVGKTELSVALANYFNAVVISADSRQFYKELKIGTAYPSDKILQAVPHFLLGHKSVNEDYSCGKFEIQVLELLKELFKQHQVVFMVGGSGLYIDAVCSGIDDFPSPDPEVREELYRQLENEGLESLRVQLKKLDPNYYQKVDLKNTQRIIKALEVCLQTGSTYSSFLTNRSKKRDFKYLKIGLIRPREELYQRINERVDAMIADGLVDEVKSLHHLRKYNALNTVGYKEIFDYLDDKTDLATAISLIKRNTRRYSKRQMTWWGRDKEIQWFHPDQLNEVIEKIELAINQDIFLV